MDGQCLQRGFNPRKKQGNIQNGVPVAYDGVLILPCFLRKEELMNKKIVAIALIVLFVAAAVAFAGDVTITQTSTSLTVKRADSKIPVKGTVCINMERKSGDKVAKNQDWWDFDLSYTQSAIWTPPAGWTIVSYSNVMCTIP
jgi:hypothetical protein